MSKLDAEALAALAKLPEHCQASLRSYIEQHIPTGRFLRAVISNDLKGAHQHADDINMHSIGDYVRFLYQHAPGGCWGARQTYVDWIKECHHV